jgi:enoyl-CoA hydratase/carnithine racemase
MHIESPTQQLELSRQQDVAVITVNRTNRRNALTSETRRQLCALIDSLATDAATRAIVLASGNAAFSSGQDLSEAKDFPVEFIPVWIKEHMDLYASILRYPRPLLAAIDGCCVGAGLQMALLCDMRVGSESAYFMMPELDDAIPCILGVWTLWDIIGRARTYEMVLTNRAVHAHEALQWGILNHVVPGALLLLRAIDTALFLASKPSLALKLTKERLADLALREADSLAKHAVAAHMEAFASGEPAAAMTAFLEHRRVEAPEWLAPSTLSLVAREVA